MRNIFFLSALVLANTIVNGSPLDNHNRNVEVTFSNEVSPYVDDTKGWGLDCNTLWSIISTLSSQVQALSPLYSNFWGTHQASHTDDPKASTKMEIVWQPKAWDMVNKKTKCYNDMDKNSNVEKILSWHEERLYWVVQWGVQEGWWGVPGGLYNKPHKIEIGNAAHPSPEDKEDHITVLVWVEEQQLRSPAHTTPWRGKIRSRIDPERKDDNWHIPTSLNHARRTTRDFNEWTC